MEKLRELTREVAIIVHNDFKQNAKVLITGGHLSLTKVHQYDRAMCDFDDLPSYHKTNYLVYAQDIIKLVENHISTTL